MKTLGAYFVPLHLNGEIAKEASERDLARVLLNHWRSMIARSNGKGFRSPPGTGSKRKHYRNPRQGELDKIFVGLAFQARYGSTHV